MADANNPTPKTMRQRHRASADLRRSKTAVTDHMPTFVNYDYSHWREIWRSIRHAMIGEVEVKRHGKTYLPKPEGMDNEQYKAYLDRAPFYNMVYRTVTGLTGAIFRRDPRLLNAGPLLTKRAERISKDGLSLPTFNKVIAQELLSTGRYGVLVDKAADGLTAQPYLAPYTCENILDWTTTEIDGMTEVDYVLLREFTVDRRLSVPAGTKTAANVNYGSLFVSYRVLRLTYNNDMARWEYHQEFYTRDNEDADLTEVPEISIPMVFGVPMTRIPFRFFNATTNLPDVEKPPILDILTLNIHHYKVYAQLNHARYFTSNPVYYVTGAGDADEYHIGPSVVWEIGAGEKAGLLEYSGRGLDSLEKGIAVLESQVASLGGRLIGDSGSAGQSDNQIKLKDRNEQSLLLNVTTVINENMTALLRIVADWMNENSADIIFRVNQDFLLDGAAAREFRAVAMMHKDGQLPVDIFYEYFLKAEVIPEYVDLDTFKAMLDDGGQFPNNADVAAVQEGFPSAQGKLQKEIADDLLEEDGRQFDDGLDHEEEQAEQDRKNAVTVAKNTPKVAPVPSQASQANSRDPAPKPKPAKKAPVKK